MTEKAYPCSVSWGLVNSESVQLNVPFYFEGLKSNGKLPVNNKEI